MTARRVTPLPNAKGPAAWNAILGDGASYPPIKKDGTADFVVIGAGFAGLSAARRLVQLVPDASITVLDAGRIAEGSAGRNSGFMIDLPHDLSSSDYAGSSDDAAMITLNRQAIAFAAQAVEEYQINPHFFDRAGKINGAVSDAAHAHNLRYAKHLESLGETSEMLDSADMTDVTGSRYYRSGLYTPGTAMLQPAGYIRGLAAGLARDGIKIHENSAVTTTERRGNTWHVTTPQGVVNAGRVILTVNGHLESFGFATGRLMHVFLFATMTPELDAETLQTLGGQNRWGVTPADPMGTTVRRIDSNQGGNRIVTRTCAVLRPDQTVRKSDVSRAARVMQQKFASRFPQCADLRMEYTWAGQLCLSLNGVAVMKQIDDGLFSGCVQNGLGTARGTLTGIGAAELAVGVQSDITRHFTAQNRPKRLPPQPFQSLGANSVLRWKEWRARHE